MMKRRKPDWDRETYLYRLYDDEDVLLYVGISYDVDVRLAKHMRRQPWGHLIARCDDVKFASRREARFAESLAIQDEHPRFNQRGGTYTPDADESEAMAKERDEVLAKRDFEMRWQLATELAAGILAAGGQTT